MVRVLCRSSRRPHRRSRRVTNARLVRCQVVDVQRAAEYNANPAWPSDPETDANCNESLDHTDLRTPTNINKTDDPETLRENKLSSINAPIRARTHTHTHIDDPTRYVYKKFPYFKLI